MSDRDESTNIVSTSQRNKKEFSRWQFSTIGFIGIALSLTCLVAGLLLISGIFTKTNFSDNLINYSDHDSTGTDYLYFGLVFAGAGKLIFFTILEEYEALR